MSELPLRRAAIKAVGHYVPDDVLTNADLEKMVDTSDEWIRTRTGIKERRILRDPDKATSFMATQVAQQILEKSGLSPEDVDVIVLATITPDMFFPSAACLTASAIGAKNAWAFDLSAACSGFLYALSTGASMIEGGRYKNVLVIGADKMSSIINYEDRNTCILFGDGAAGVLLQETEDETGIIDSILATDASNWSSLCMPGGGSLKPASAATIAAGDHYLYQEGKTVFKMAVNGMANVAAEIVERNQLAPEDIRYLVPHQANLRIIDATARKMGIDDSKVMINIDRYGNTTAATIPLCLADWEKDLKKGDNLIFAAFGGGFTWGATYVKWSYDTP